MKQLIIDGYNVIHKIPLLATHLNARLEESRKALANFLSTWRRTHAYSGKICIVFDGKDGIVNNNLSLCGIKCIYTKTKQEADDRIIAMVKSSRGSKTTTVISNDNYVQNNCKVHGATVKSAEFLLQPPKSRKLQAEKNIDPATEKDINEYMKKEWGL